MAAVLPNLTGSSSHDLEAFFVIAAASAVAFVALWYLAAGLALLVSARHGSRNLRARVARWGPPVLKGLAATMLAGSFALPAAAAPDIDLSWGAAVPQTESADAPSARATPEAP